MEHKVKYIQLPISIIPGVFGSTVRFIVNAFHTGVYLLSSEIRSNFDDMSRQLIYNYITHPNNLTKKLQVFLKKNEEVLCLDDFKNNRQFFFPKGFDLIIGQDLKLLELLDNNEDMCFEALTWYRYYMAFKYLEFNIYSMDSAYVDFNSYDFTGQPRFMLKLDTFKSCVFADSWEESRQEFAGFAAIKSILGKKDYLLTNKQLIAARMAGGNSIKDDRVKSSDIFKKYSQRYHMDRLLQKLELNWHVKTLSKPGLHGLYVTTKLSIDELAMVVEERFIKNQVQKLKESKVLALQKAKAHYGT